MLCLPEGFLGISCDERLVARTWGKWAHETFSLLVVTCMPSMPPMNGHNILWGNRIFIGQGGEGDRPSSGWFWGVGALEKGVNIK
jgi:hypothetical protein